jgi:hypothetical protein
VGSLCTVGGSSPSAAGDPAADREHGLVGRVGTLAEPATTAHRAVMEAAGERDESPCTRARTPRPEHGGYLLEVQLPD